MHPVIRNILVRQGKKVPTNDGRRIALVLYGGIMNGVRGAGAMIALEELGLSHAFDEIYTYSAGFPNALCLLSESARAAARVYYEYLSGKKFIRYTRLKKIIDIDYLLEVYLRHRPFDAEKARECQTRLFVRLYNSKDRQVEYLEIHDFSAADIEQISKAAVSVPFLHPGSVAINGSSYMDTHLINGRPQYHLRHALNSSATDVLVIYNRPSQRKQNLDLERVLEIAPTGAFMSPFETNTEELKTAAQSMGDLVKSYFGDSTPISLDYVS